MSQKCDFGSQRRDIESQKRDIESQKCDIGSRKYDIGPQNVIKSGLKFRNNYLIYILVILL